MHLGKSGFVISVNWDAVIEILRSIFSTPSNSCSCLFLV